MSLIFSIVIKKIKHNHMTWHPFIPVWYHFIRLPLYNSNCQVNQHVRMKFGIGIKIMTHYGNLVISFIFVSGINNSNTRSYVIKIDPKNTFFTIFILSYSPKNCFYWLLESILFAGIPRCANAHNCLGAGREVPV